ncbi:MAG: LysR family transcriptional regulator, partial [Gammaproteobacteria bacterium]
QELALKRLVVLDVAEFPIMRHWYVVHRKGKRLSAAAEAFKRFPLVESTDRAPANNTGKSAGRKRHKTS